MAGWGRTVSRASTAANRRLIRNKVNVKVLQSLKVPIANGKCGPGAAIEIDTNRQICAGGEKGKWESSSFSFGSLWPNTRHGLRTPNEGINQRNLKIWADVADKICFGLT